MSRHNRWRCPVTTPAIIVTPNGQALSALLWDEFRASQAKPVSLAQCPAIIGHTRPISAAPVVVQ